MPQPVKSRHGLTRCTACRAHIQAGDTPSRTECPFCGATLTTATRRILPSGRSGLLAASLFTLSAAGCGSPQADGEPTVTTEPSDDNQNTSGGDQFAPRPADDNTAVAEYGIAADDEDTWGGQAEDPRPAPRYGLPPSRR